MTAPKPPHLLLKVPWSPEEDALLRATYAIPDGGLLVERFPGRSLGSIRRRACELSLKRGFNPGNSGNVRSPITIREGVEGKECIGGCGWQPLGRFPRHETCVGGRRNICSRCAGRQAYERHPEKLIANVRAYQARHPSRVRETKRVGDARHRSLLSWRRTRIAIRELELLLDGFDGGCVYCFERADTFDHVKPLSRGGEDRIENLLPACRPCNSSKKDKTLEEWQGRRGTAYFIERKMVA